MSLTDAPSLVVPPLASAQAGPAHTRSNRPVYAWEAVKTLFAVVTFTAMLLPLAFPSKAGTQARLAQAPAGQMPAAETPVTVAAKPAKVAASPTRNSVVPQPAKKPPPKNT